MQQEEKSNLEERIIAHFDGSLDRASSKSLFDEVMASPEKRALFRAHETLDRVIAAARVPMEAPLETRREIAEKIPGLIAFIPGLIGTAETMPILTQSANPIMAFFARMSMQTAISIGSAIAVLTTAGIIVKNNMDRNAAPVSTPKIAAMQSAVPQNSAPSRIAAAAAPRYVMAAPKAISNIHSNNRSGIVSHRATGIVPAQSMVMKQNVPPIVAMPQNNSEPQDNTPAITNTFDTPRHASEVAANIPVIQTDILTSLPDDDDEGITVRAYASSGFSSVMLNGINKSGLSPEMQSTTLGLEFDLGDHWAFRAQGGQAPFAEVIASPENQMIPSLLGPSIQVYGPGMDAKEAGWATVGGSYTYLTPIAPIIVGLDAGVAFMAQKGFLSIASVGTDLPVGDRLSLRPMLTLSMLGTSLTPLNVNGIYEAPTASTLWSSAVGFQFTIVYRP